MSDLYHPLSVQQMENMLMCFPVAPSTALVYLRHLIDLISSVPLHAPIPQFPSSSVHALATTDPTEC